MSNSNSQHLRVSSEVQNWDAESARSVIQFFEQYLVYVDGPDEGKPIKLREWQA